MQFSNTSVELVRHGKQPRQPMSNDQRLQLFRRRHAATCTTEFNTAFPAGRLAGTHPKKEQHA